MIESLRSAQRRDFFAFGEGLSSLFRGDDTEESDAAASLLGETVLMHRAWLKTKFK